MKIAYPWTEWNDTSYKRSQGTIWSKRYGRHDAEGVMLVYILTNGIMTGWLVKSYLESDSFYLKHGPYSTIEEAKEFADALLLSKNFQPVDAKFASMI